MSALIENADSAPSKVNKTRESAPLLPAIFDVNAPKNYSSTNDESVNIKQDIKIVKDENDGNKTSRSSLFGVFLNLSNALIGAGILAIPYCYSKCGIIGGIILMAIFAVICCWTLNLMIIAGKKMNVCNYEDLGYECYGYYGYILVALCLFLLDYGVMLTCLIIIGDCSFAIMNIWNYSSKFDRQIVILIVSFIIIFPLCLKRNIAHIEIFSFIKFLALLTVSGSIIYECINNNIKYDNIIWFDINGIPFALGVFAFAFVCHDTAFLYYKSLYNPTLIRFTKLSFGGIGSAMFISIILSIPAYLTFTINVNGNILNNYSVSSYLIIIVRILYILTMALTYPIPLFIVRHISYAVYIRWKYKDSKIHNFEQKVNYNIEHASYSIHFLFSLIIFGSTLTISMFVDNLGIAMSLIGNLSSINLAFVFPCLFYIKTCDYHWKFWQYHQYKDQINSFLAIYPPIILAIFGGIMCPYSIILTLSHSNNNN